jgi:hypothetical protein
LVNHVCKSFIREILTILGKDTNDRGILVDVFNGIFDLKEATIGVEGGRTTIVSRLKEMMIISGCLMSSFD